MDISEGKTVVEMIREKYNQIFMAERKVADFVLQNPERAVNANVSELRQKNFRNWKAHHR